MINFQIIKFYKKVMDFEREAYLKTRDVKLLGEIPRS